MSHSLPGLQISRAEGVFQVEMAIKNWGSTPAKVTDVVVTANVLPNAQPLPRYPPYARHREEKIKAFLVTTEEFFYLERFPTSENEMRDVESGASKILLFGYVDYIDKFEQHHRGGYARTYQGARPGNNLLFVVQEEYNYDRPRRPDEGNDWSEL